MDRLPLIDHVRQLLAQAGFAVSDRCDLRPVSFDLVARRDRELVVVKVLGNVDAMGEAIADEIKLLCRFLEARPLLVGLRSGTGELEPGVVYARYEIPILHPDTLTDYLLEGQRPMVFAAPGGFYVRLNGSELRSSREAHGISLGTLAQVAGVSRRAIQMYEQGMNASIDAAMRLEEFLGAELIRPMDPLHMDPGPDHAPHKAHPASNAKEPKVDPMETLVRRILEGMGYDVRATRRSPFDAISSQGTDTLLTGIGRDSPQLRRRVRIVADVGRVIERPAFFVVERTRHQHIEGVPIVDRRELRRLTDPEAILELILERSRPSTSTPPE